MEKQIFKVTIDTSATNQAQIEYLQQLISRAVYDACVQNNDDPRSSVVAHLDAVVTSTNP